MKKTLHEIISTLSDNDLSNTVTIAFPEDNLSIITGLIVGQFLQLSNFKEEQNYIQARF